MCRTCKYTYIACLSHRTFSWHGSELWKNCTYKYIRTWIDIQCDYAFSCRCSPLWKQQRKTHTNIQEPDRFMYLNKKTHILLMHGCVYVARILHTLAWNMSFCMARPRRRRCKKMTARRFSSFSATGTRNSGVGGRTTMGALRYCFFFGVCVCVCVRAREHAWNLMV